MRMLLVGLMACALHPVSRASPPIDVTILCDAGYPTFLLSYWTRDRPSGRVSLPWAIKALTQDTARAVGLHDRGILAVGYKADLNIIDYERMNVYRPYITSDLPGGGSRLVDDPDGYVATIVSGKTVYSHGKPTGELPGKLVRGRQEARSALALQAS